MRVFEALVVLLSVQRAALASEHHVQPPQQHALKGEHNHRVAESDAAPHSIANSTSPERTSFSGTGNDLPTTLAHSQCTLYMAQSTVDDGGLGVFTRLPKVRGDRIGWGGDPSIPIDFKSFIHSAKDASIEQSIYLLRNYTWTRDDREVLNLGLSSLLNSHLAAANAGSIKFDSFETVALGSIPANGEVFGYYGDHWFQEREYEVPTSEDYDLAEELAKTLVDVVPQEKLQDVLDLIHNWKMVHNKHTWNALPSNKDDLLSVAQSSMSEHHQAVKDDLLSDPSARCVDSIQVKNNKAYAVRDFHPGDIITGSPLLHFVEGAKILPQDFLNVCYAHDQSTLVLCPYAPGVTSIQPSNASNVEVQWAPHGQLHHNADLLKLPAETLLNQTKPVLAVDYVAKEFIPAGTELTLGLRNVQRRQDDSSSLGSLILRTQEEQVQNPYDHPFECHPGVASLEFADVWKESIGGLPCQIQDRFVDPMTAYITYSVRIQINDSWIGIGGVPRRFIRFAETKHQSLHLSIFPVTWQSR